MSKRPTTLGELKKQKYTPHSVKDEMRRNLRRILKGKEKVFEGIQGFDDTVIPDIERAILSRHNILLLGLRGQAKTRLARLMTNLLDEYIPYVEGSDVNDDPLNPISYYARETIREKGDDTPIAWMHRSERYVEKLATPDVSVADLIGDIDPIKAANMKLHFSDERVINYGLVPRSHRSIFVINELPDLQARIQVSLFNILQEGDLQIRGFKLRLPLDIMFVFTANPEDYTNRGSIITPLKDRIESQILTHYPEELAVAKSITEQEAQITEDQLATIEIPSVLRDLLERVAFKARDSEYIDEKSGVSARLSISGLENLFSTAERRMIRSGDDKTTARITDFWGVIPSITGKVELVYEGEQEGPYEVALHLIDEAIKDTFLDVFPHPEKKRRGEEKDPYGTIRAWFSGGHEVDLANDASNEEFEKALRKVAGLEKFVENYPIPKGEKILYMELVLHGLAAFNVINKELLDSSLSFSDLLADMLSDLDEDDE